MLAAIKRTRKLRDQSVHDLGNRVRGRQLQRHRRVHPQAVVGIGRALDEEGDGLGRNGVKPGQRIRGVCLDLNLRVAQGLDQVGDSLVRDDRRVHPAR